MSLIAACSSTDNKKSSEEKVIWHQTLLYYGLKQPSGDVVPDIIRCPEDCAKKCLELNMKYYNHKLIEVMGLPFDERDDPRDMSKRPIINYHCECYCNP